MRTVGGNIHKIGLAAPNNIFLQAVYPLVAALEQPRLSYVRIHRKRIKLYIAFLYTGDGNITEAHICQPRTIRLLSVSAIVYGGLFCASQKFDIRRSVGIQKFGVAKRNFLTRFAVYLRANDPCEILTEIVYQFSAYRRRARQRHHFFVRSHGRAVICDDFRIYFYLFFFCGVQIHKNVQVRSSVENFSVVKVACLIPAVQRNLPALIRTDGFDAAVVIGHSHFAQKRLSGRGNSVLAGKDKRTHRPTAADFGNELSAVFQKLRGVVYVV